MPLWMNNITSGCPAGINTQQYVSAEISPCRINACYDGKLIMKTTDSAVIHALRITATIVIMRLNTPNFFFYLQSIVKHWHIISIITTSLQMYDIVRWKVSRIVKMECFHSINNIFWLLTIYQWQITATLHVYCKTYTEYFWFNIKTKIYLRYTEIQYSAYAIRSVSVAFLSLPEWKILFNFNRPTMISATVYCQRRRFDGTASHVLLHSSQRV